MVWDRKTGTPIYPAIVWQDRRTASDCDALRQQGLEPLVQMRTGLLLDPYFSATKLRWILDHVDGARSRANRGELAFGTVDSWLIYNLTGGTVHVTDATNASRTLLMDLKTLDWDSELLEVLDIPRNLLPRICSNSEMVGETVQGLFGDRIPICGIAGDQQSALFGQACTKPGMAKNTYGTGCFLLMNTADKPVSSKARLLTTFAWECAGKPTYALEGSVFTAGAVVQWLRDGLGIIRDSAEVEALAASVPDSEGVTLVPAFVGLGAPHWDSYARGTIQGLTRGTHRAHIARAALESIAFQTAEVLLAMEADSKVRLEELRVDGGASRNDLLMQIQADVLGVPVVRPKVTETTAAGAAYFAGIACGFWRDEAWIADQWRAERRFEPRTNSGDRDRQLARWRKALERSKAWEEPS